MGWTQEKCAEEWEMSVLTIRRLELNSESKHLGEYPATRKTAKQISEKTGIYWEYWYGLSAVKDKKRYDESVLDNREREIATAEAQEADFAEFIKKVNSYRGLFFMLGYNYENIERTAAYDFSAICPEHGKPLQPHNLTPISGNGETLNLSNTQIEMIICYLKKQLAFALFDVSRPQHCGVPSPENNSTGAV